MLKGLFCDRKNYAKGDFMTDCSDSERPCVDSFDESFAGHKKPANDAVCDRLLHILQY